MKKLIITLIATLPSLTGFAQGTINFCNIGAGLNAPVYNGSPTKLSTPWLAGLYAGPSSTSLAYVGNSAPFLTGGGAGYFVGGTVTLPGIRGGSTAWLQVWVWDPTLGGTTTGATLTMAIASGRLGVYDCSSIFSVVTGDPTTSPPGIPATMVGLQSFDIGCLGPYFGGVQYFSQNQSVLVGTLVDFYLFVMACPPPLYQWYFNGSPIPGAVFANYRISSVQLTNAGIYSVTADSGYWNFHYSAAATLTVLAPPTLTSSPQSQTAEAGTTVGFTIQYAGSPAPGCQWFFNGNRLNDATNALLRLPDVQPAQAGPYTVVLTNSVGAVTSPPAMLGVIPLVQRTLVPALTLIGQPGTSLNLDYADMTNPGGNWQPLESVPLTNSSQFYFDLSTSPTAQRFYRGWQAGASGPASRLDLDMVPALTVTGPVGSGLRVDAINAIGPTNAWFTLDTVTLTNASQLYLDVSSIHQPRRFWRIVPQ